MSKHNLGCDFEYSDSSYCKLPNIDNSIYCVVHSGVPNQMTTDHELLARIDKYIEKLSDYIRHLKELISHDSHKSEPDWALVQYLDIAETSLKHLKGNRAVVELHKSNPDRLVDVLYGDKEFFVEKEPSCNYCYDKPYPCPTIQAIEKELG